MGGAVVYINLICLPGRKALARLPQIGLTGGAPGGHVARAVPPVVSFRDRGRRPALTLR